MATIAENLTKLQAARTNIASAITAKGGTVASGDGFEDFASDIGSIPAGSTAAKLTPVSTVSSPSELYIVEEEYYIYCYGTVKLGGNTSVVFNVPNEFDMSKIGSIRGESVFSYYGSGGYYRKSCGATVDSTNKTISFSDLSTSSMSNPRFILVIWEKAI